MQVCLKQKEPFSGREAASRVVIVAVVVSGTPLLCDVQLCADKRPCFLSTSPRLEKQATGDTVAATITKVHYHSNR